jgi:hypothetical protein
MESVDEEKDGHLKGMRCVFCCSGRLECDCQVPQEIMKEYGTLVGRKGAESAETTPDRGLSRRGSTATLSSTATLVQTVSPTSVRSTSSTRSLFPPKMRRRLSLVPVLERLRFLSKASSTPPPEEEQQHSAHTFTLPEELCAITRPVLPRGYSSTLGDLWGVNRGICPAVTDKIPKEKPKHKR